jgi:hypothetical protein
MSVHKNLISKIIMTSGYLILFCAILFFLSKASYKDDVIFIKDLIGVASTIFAALVALYIFQEWAVQKKLEALSNNAKEKISEIPSLSMELVSFNTSSLDLINRKDIYKKNQDSRIFQHMTELSTSLYKHPFIAIAVNFDMSFREIKDLMLESDLEIYEALSKNMKSYKELIFKEKILNLNNEITNDDIKRFEVLHQETESNLSKFYRRLIDYKNFDYKQLE